MIKEQKHNVHAYIYFTIITSGIAIILSLVTIFRYDYRTDLEIDYLGGMVAIISLAVTVFVTVQIYQSFNLKKDIDERMICIALFATAATIIRQIIHTYNTVVLYALPVLGYLTALLTFICGWEYISEAATASHFVAGHVICGVAFITACVATTATSSTRFTLIPANSQTTENDVPPQAFNGTQGKLLIVVAALLALATWIWTFQLLAKSDVHNAYYVAGHVMAGIACICTSLVALVATIVRQIRNSYSHAERKWWPVMVLAMGTLSILWGLLILKNPNPAESSIGYIMIGLGLVCYSISSKVILLAAIWRNTFKLANRIPLIPVFTALLCLFLSAFLFEMASIHEVYFVPARVLAGLGGICFTLFSIVSILESGTSKG